MTSSFARPGIWKKTRLDRKQNYKKLRCDKFDVLDMNSKSNELENEIAQLKINKSQKLESSSNVSVENTNEIKKMKDSITDINTKLYGKFNPNRKKHVMLKLSSQHVCFIYTAQKRGILLYFFSKC